MLEQHHGRQRTISATEMRRNFSAIVRRLRKRREHTIIASRGKPVAVLLPLSEYERLTARDRSAALDD
jgi:prevent-host-death family protein